jgi:short-subunit dehydrogenase
MGQPHHRVQVHVHEPIDIGRVRVLEPAAERHAGIVDEEVPQIVNLSSVFGIIAPAGQAAYAASKFAVRGFTEALRHEVEGTGLGVTLVHPGGVATAIARNARRPRTMDPHEAAEAHLAFERLLTMSPAKAAAAILRGIETRAPRVVIDVYAIRRAFTARRMVRS